MEEPQATWSGDPENKFTGPPHPLSPSNRDSHRWSVEKCYIAHLKNPTNCMCDLSGHSGKEMCWKLFIIWNKSSLLIISISCTLNQEECFHQYITNCDDFSIVSYFLKDKSKVLKDKLHSRENPCLPRSTVTYRMLLKRYSYGVQWHICGNLLVITNRWLLIIFLYGCQETHITFISHSCWYSTRTKGCAPRRVQCKTVMALWK